VGSGGNWYADSPDLRLIRINVVDEARAQKLSLAHPASIGTAD
jgi:hypothetical protein